MEWITRVTTLLFIEDRWPNWRDRSFLYKVDTKTGISERLTYGNQTAGLEDISSNGKYILVSTSQPDYTQQPFSLNCVYQINLETLAVDTIIKNNRFDLSVSYSPTADKILVLAGPSAFGKAGENIKKGQVANNFDTQAYILNLQSKEVEPITKNFNPKIMIGSENSDYRSLDQISNNLKNAILTSEDGSFFWHRGFNEEAIRGAIIADLKKGGFAKGGSTISMAFRRR